jgi:hypothetical protein
MTATTTASADRGTTLRVWAAVFAFIEQPVCGLQAALVKSERECAHVFAASSYTT